MYAAGRRSRAAGSAQPGRPGLRNACIQAVRICFCFTDLDPHTVYQCARADEQHISIRAVAPSVRLFLLRCESDVSGIPQAPGAAAAPDHHLVHGRHEAGLLVGRGPRVRCVPPTPTYRTKTAPRWRMT